MINLSMGAAPSGSYATNPAYAPAQAVADATRMAACYDLPMFVAAGNRDLEDVNCEDPGDGLMLPATLEGMPMPTPAECQTWGYVPDWDTTVFPRAIDSTSIDKPLVTAVGGVDHEDHLLPTNRLGSTTILAAPAFAAVTPSGETTLTGTSIAALVATAGANLVWSASPELHSRDMVGALYSTGWETDLTIEAGWDPYAEMTVNRISLCAALDLFHETLNCMASAPPSNPTAGIARAIVDTIALEGVVSPGGVETTNEPVCETGPVDLMIPLPTRPNCANCTADIQANNQHTLYMTIAPESWMTNLVVVGAVMQVVDSTNKVTDYHLSSAVITEINSMDGEIIAVPFTNPGPVAATLKFKYDDASVAINTLYLY